jgi:hypothetical protein
MVFRRPRDVRAAVKNQGELREFAAQRPAPATTGGRQTFEKLK